MKCSPDPAAVLRAFVAQHPTQTAAARALGVGDAYLSDLLHGRRLFSDVMLAKLGLERVIVTRKAS